MAELFASGMAWVGSGVRSVETGLCSIFSDARRRVVACCYSVSEEFDLAPGWIADAVRRDVRVVMVVNRVARQDRAAMARLDAVAAASDLFEFWDYDGPPLHDLHAKVFVRDECYALIGSSNLSRNGLLRNHELAVAVEGDAARRAADLVVGLTRSTSASRRC
ncbi:phospholipase D-like domain-containing protein [Mesorhizobium sp. M0674]|uniref:phospholipase D-like domain-containing protein n=1 Tax=unclassified Mesorhizobium TaxID=325217 RepID=UPI0033388CA8